MCKWVCVCVWYWGKTFVNVCVCVFVCACLTVCVCVCVCVCQWTCHLPISMEIKGRDSHNFTHSPCFDSIQSTVCIITPVQYGNLLGPKYWGLTNPSFVFRHYTKHKSCFSTQAVSTHTHAPHIHKSHENRAVEPNAGRLVPEDTLGSRLVINISVFQMADLLQCKDSTAGQGNVSASLWRVGQDGTTFVSW